MNLDRERELFWKWANDENPLLVEEAETGSQSHKDMLDHMFMGWLASANREGYKLVPAGGTNIADTIWGKCPCGSSRSPIISDKVGYNLIHCFACGANEYTHEGY